MHWMLELCAPAADVAEIYKLDKIYYLSKHNYKLQKYKLLLVHIWEIMWLWPLIHLFYQPYTWCCIITLDI